MAIEIDEPGLVQLFPEIDDIGDRTLRQGVVEIWQRTARGSGWSKLEDIPKNLGSERHRRLTDHVRGVTRMALQLAETAKEIQGRAYDRDRLIVACLLHDVSKVVECEPDPAGQATGGPALPGRRSDIGKMLPHAVYATHEVLKQGLPLEIANLVVTHTHDCNVRSAAIEAVYLFYADFADSDAGNTSGKLFSERFKLA